jgi:hypothetical protein
MKTTTSNSFELKEFSKLELTIIKVAIILFGIAINISAIGLSF